MEKQDTLTAMALIALFIALLLSVFLITVETKNRLPNQLLASFILFCGLDIAGLFINQYPVLFLFSKTFTFLIFPSFFLYVLSISSVDFKLKPTHLYHAILFGFYNLILLFYFFVLMPSGELTILAEVFQKLPWLFNSLLLKLQAAGYIVATLLILRKHKKIYLANYTQGNIKVYNWLYRMVLIFLFTFPVTLAKEYLPFTDFSEVLKWLNSSLIVIALLMFCWLVLKAMYTPELFRSVDLKIALSKVELKHKQGEIGSGKDHDALLTRLNTFMAEQEPYLNPSLTLHELSSQLNITARSLSCLINNEMGQHFFDFVNAYRVKKAGTLLKDISNNKYTIQQIFYDAGFNSKSSFNTAFKKHTGMTPTEFIKKNA